MTGFTSLTAAALALSSAAPSGTAGATCERDWYDDRPSPTASKRAVRPEDLMALRDIGTEADLPDEPMFKISPDGERAALQLRRADVPSNSYCLAMIVIDLRGRRAPVVVDRGGEALRWRFPSLLGKADFANGLTQTITPSWSPDGRAIFFLKKTGPAVQIWRANSDGSGAAALTRTSVDVAKFGVRADGSIVFATRTGAVAMHAALAEEGRSGFRFDARFMPAAAAVPFAPGPLPLSYESIDRDQATSRKATATEKDWLERQGSAADDGPYSLWAETVDTTRFPPTTALAARTGTGLKQLCADARCRDPYPEAFWWSPDKRSILFLRRDGWAREAFALHRWTPATGRVTRLFATNDSLSSCQMSGPRLICVHEAATRPRRIVGIDPDKGRMTAIFDANRDYAALQSGRVERLRWRTSGVETFADLVYPVGYRRAKRYPLVVVQYWSRGFLRGGTGDDYPIQAFAGRGYFILSLQNPHRPSVANNAQDAADRERNALKDFAGRRLILDALEIALGQLIARGVVDPKRIGITGLSDGAATVQFASLNSTMFSAGAVSSCCCEPSQDAMLGPTIADLYHSVGYPRLIDDDRAFWSKISWQHNPGRVAFPVLMQLTDREYLNSLHSYTALRQAGRPAAMYVFPDEDHIKIHPAHRDANYRRSLAWFDFWLRPELPTRPEDRTFAADWAALRAIP